MMVIVIAIVMLWLVILCESDGWMEEEKKRKNEVG